MGSGLDLALLRYFSSFTSFITCLSKLSFYTAPLGFAFKSVPARGGEWMKFLYRGSLSLVLYLYSTFYFSRIAAVGSVDEEHDGEFLFL